MRRSHVIFDGDRATGYGVYSDGTLTGAVTYGVATDSAGDRATVSASRSDIHVLNSAQQALDVRGTSGTYSVAYAKHGLGGDTWGVGLSATGSYIRSEDDVSGVTTGTSIVKEGAGGVSAFGLVSTYGRISGDLILSHADGAKGSGPAPRSSTRPTAISSSSAPRPSASPCGSPASPSTTIARTCRAASSSSWAG